MGRRQIGKVVLRGLLVALIAGTIGLSVVAVSEAGPQYPVMNTSETQPDGVWFRNSPRTADTNRETGHGVYRDERVELLCFGWGEPVGPHGNKLWYAAKNVTRPTVNGHENSGWLNAHYVNDGTAANEVAPGVPDCGTGDQRQNAPPPRRASVYYSPYPMEPAKRRGRVMARSPASDTLLEHEWSNPDQRCSIHRSNDFDPVINGAPVKTLAGWSVGRMGPIYLMKADPKRAASIDYILLLDPGNRKELKGDCFSNEISGLYAKWLENPQHQLVILAGKATRDIDTRNGRFAHRGIQEVYFPKIRGTAAARRVTVCNYNGMEHEDLWDAFAPYIDHHKPITDKTCPKSAQYKNPVAWHP